MLKIEKLHKVFAKNNIKALHNINLNIEKGEIVGLLGPNGAGKSTLIGIISGLITKGEGQIFINNIEHTKKNNNKLMSDLGVMLEGERNLYWRLTVRNNLLFFGSIKGMGKKEIIKAIHKYSKLFNIEDIIARKVKTLSSGQKSKVSVIVSLIHDPQLLMLDEPAANLDIEARQNLISHLKLINHKLDKTIIITSHDVNFLRGIVDRFIIINKGKIKQRFNNNELSANEIEEKYRETIRGDKN